MAVRIKDGMIPYTGGDGIEITNNHVINVKLREEDNLTHINDDKELYTDLQLENGIAPTDTFPVGANTGTINTEDGWSKSGQILNWKTISGDYARLLVTTSDHKVFIDTGDGIWREIGVEGSNPDINTKTFYLPSDLASAEAIQVATSAYSWFKDTKNPILMYEKEMYVLAYDWTSYSSPRLSFISTDIVDTIWENKGTGQIASNKLDIWIDPNDDTITGIQYISKESDTSVLEFIPTTATSTAFEPTQPSHPATKKYVDEQIAEVQPTLTAGDYIDITNNVISNTKPFNPINDGTTGYILAYTSNGEYHWIDGSSIPTPVDSNVVYYPLPDTTSASYSIAKDAYDWASIGGNLSIVGLDSHVYIYSHIDGNNMIFTEAVVGATQGGSMTTISNNSLIITVDNQLDVTGITVTSTPVVALIDPTATYTTPYTPTQLYNPVTKNYVDTQITNISADINTKTFFLPDNLSSPSAINVMQAAYDWQIADTNRQAIVVHSDDSSNLPKQVYVHYWTTSNQYVFQCIEVQKDGLILYQDIIYASISGGSVTSINHTAHNVSAFAKVLTTDNTTSYTPTANYHPATKKYVDGKVSDCLTESKNYTDTKVISGASFGGHVNAAKANGTRYDSILRVYNDMSGSSSSQVSTYTMQGLGWIKFGTYATRGANAWVKLNGEYLELKTSSPSSSADSMSNSGILSVSTGDVIEVGITGYESEATATIVDYY